MIKQLSNYIMELELKTNLTCNQISGTQHTDILDRCNAFIDKQIFTTPRGAICIKTNTIESQLKLSITRSLIIHIRHKISNY